MKINFPRTNLGFWPTPMHACPNLTKRLAKSHDAPSIYIKRDDQSGLGLGGNKVRKLEFLLGDAIEQDCDTLITGGAAQSNHCRQTAAAAAKCGLQCHLVLGGEAPDHANGNLLLGQLFGANIHWAGEHRKGEDLPQLAKDLEKSGRKPYLVEYGGSSAIGALGFVAAMAELKKQLLQTTTDITHIVFASSSGGTHAGLTVGAFIQELPITLYGIGIDKRSAQEAPFNALVSGICNELGVLLDIEHRYQPSDLILDEQFIGGGYGVISDLERRAIALLAQSEGILLDPVYSGRAFGAMIALIEQGVFTKKDQVLFWHTGGTPALFANASLLTQ